MITEELKSRLKILYNKKEFLSEELLYIDHQIKTYEADLKYRVDKHINTSIQQDRRVYRGY